MSRFLIPQLAWSACGRSLLCEQWAAAAVKRLGCSSALASAEQTSPILQIERNKVFLQQSQSQGIGALFQARGV